MPTDLKAGVTLAERFLVLEPLGEGGQGTTWIAQDLTNQSKVVVKVLSLATVEDWKADERFRREIAILSQLSHPNVPRVVDAFEGSDGQTYLIQEFIDGHNLLQLLEAGEVWSDQKIRGVLIDILQVLEYLHRHSPPIIHRDIKPSNIIRDMTGRHVLIDFGAVRLASTSATTVRDIWRSSNSKAKPIQQRIFMDWA